MNSEPSQPLSLSLADIDPHALHIVKSLQRRGFTTYLVGGCVRDLLLGKNPKDFDIATLARPRDVRQAVGNAFIIGKRFQLVLVKRGDQQYEVSTFRRDARPDETSDELPAGDNLFGSPEEDAKRRDFTINALFYDPYRENGELIDFADGLRDLRAGVVRMIGDPNLRLIEDPIRIMRGIRLAHMIRFTLDAELREGMQKHAGSLPGTALPRRREEILKYLRLENPALPFLTSLDLGVLDFVSPRIAEALRDTARSEMFLKYLFTFHDKKLESPMELFAGLIMAYFMSSTRGECPQDSKSLNILENEDIVKLMRDELGMFKSEQLTVAKAIQMMALIARRKDFENRGEKRRRAVVTNPAFPLAFKISEREHWLTPNDMQFWQTAFLTSGGDFSRPPQAIKTPRRRKRRHS
jgi:poly(A) polymerase